MFLHHGDQFVRGRAARLLAAGRTARPRLGAPSLALLLASGLILGAAAPALDVVAKPHKDRQESSRSAKRHDDGSQRREEGEREGSSKTRTRGASARVAAKSLSTQQLSASQAANALTGSGITVSNVTFSGDPKALGSFTSSDAALIGFTNGIILSSGFVSNVTGPNEQDDISGDNGQDGDEDLDELLDPLDEVVTEDAAVLEFDFVPEQSEIAFDYVFGSDEYLEYVDQGYNDLFAFFVNGQNCAVVNGELVSVDSINPGSNGQFFRNNTNAALNTEMDGLTTVLTCTANVNAGQTNHLKLAIADVSDSIYDSNVFLRAGSIGGPPEPPDCTAAKAKPALLDAVFSKKKKGKKKRNKKKPIPFAEVTVSGVTDPNGDTPSIEITSILTDESVGSQADASIQGSKAKVRREASKSGDGRIYRIGFTAEDSEGDSCSGSVDVGIRVKGQTPAGNPTIDATKTS